MLSFCQISPSLNCWDRGKLGTAFEENDVFDGGGAFQAVTVVHDLEDEIGLHVARGREVCEERVAEVVELIALLFSFEIDAGACEPVLQRSFGTRVKGLIFVGCCRCCSRFDRLR